MITLPNDPYPNGVQPRLVDFGFLQRPSTGAEVTRIDRPGTRYAVDLTYPMMRAEDARALISKIQRAKSEPCRLEFPLLGASQGSPSGLTVSGTPSGVDMTVTGFSGGYTPSEGYWLHVQDAAGVRYLHNVTSFTGSGSTLSLKVWPPVRAPLTTGNPVELAAPTVEGLVTGDLNWNLALGNFVQVGFTLEELA